MFEVANLTGEAFPEQVQATSVSADFFRLCGATGLHGRIFAAEDDLLNAPKTAVLSYAFWQRRFGDDAQVIGTRITLNGERYEIIGVASSNLKNGQVSEMMLGNGDITIEEPPDVYLPFQLDPNSAEHGHYFNVAGRLKPGVTLAEANAQLQASYQEYARKWPDDIRGRVGFRVQPLQDAIVGGVRHSLLILLSAVSLVLLIACANVANLLLARATGRKREIAIRAAVGAGRGRIVRQLLTESVMLSLAGGVLGLAAGSAGIHALLSLSPGNIPRTGAGGSNVSLDWRVFAFTLALSILTRILFGLVPALQSSRADLSSAPKESGNRSGTGLRDNKTRTLLVTTEMAAALVLTIFGCSALLLAAIGIYGLMAYSVAQRAQEIGIRRALGAESSHIRNMMVFQGLRPALAGVVCGLAAAFGLTRLIAGFLFGVEAWDPLVFFVVPLILVGVALVAVWVPAMRASRVDPIHALRYE